jgi:MFS family permease
VRRRVVLAATVGNTLEWYDFLVYGFLSVTIGRLFFPTGSELTSLLLSVATFGVGFVMRPIGAVVLGIYSDRVGRKAALTLTIFIMALGTGLIALTPTYDSIGNWAPLLIAVSRLLQGFSSGGELGGATAILAENAPEGRRGLYASWQAASQAAGLLLGALITMLVSLSLTPTQLEAGGWRWPFAIGLLILPVGLYVRSKLDEPELFLKARKQARVLFFHRSIAGSALADAHRYRCCGAIYRQCLRPIRLHAHICRPPDWVAIFPSSDRDSRCGLCGVPALPRLGRYLRSLRAQAAPSHQRSGLCAVDIPGVRADQYAAEPRQTSRRAVGLCAPDGNVRWAGHLGLR